MIMRPFVSISALLLLLLPLSGCEDADARQRVEVQQTLQTAQAEYRQATASRLSLRDADHDEGRTLLEQTRRDLNNVISTLSGIREGEPGQQAAAAMIATDALQDLAAMNIDKSDWIERHLSRQRLLVDGHVTGAMLLKSRAEGRQAASPDALQRDIQQLKTQAESNLRALRQQIDSLEPAIEERTTQIRDDRRRIESLRAEANELLRRAAELGPADGFGLVEEAAATRREADRVEYVLAHRDIELGHQLQPQYGVIQSQLDAQRALIESLESTLRDLDAFDSSRTDNIASLEQQVGARRDAIRESVQQITRQMSDELSPLYDESRDWLERAVSQATRAAGQVRGAEGAAARLAEARAHEMIGRLYWREARGVDQHAALLSTLIETGEIVGRTDAYRVELDDARSRHELLMEQALHAFEQARNSLDLLTGPAAELAQAARENLDTLIAALRGGEVEVGLLRSGSIGTPRVRPTG